ncbi:ABC transporter C family member 10 [Gossypium australe]|uniref:ABC transporter C family member 10 n=1 Tax=Gossypium australe TaxID=47621 RepID=A0A5B6W4E1_9ROSI|nr:ABC transporter C family member 10 [Gossypium australe]
MSFRVLKARYFSFTDILAAKVGSYPSFTWRSICNARELIEERVLWRIGKGDRVNIWNDPWLPGRENNRIFGQEIRTRWTTVNHLMQSDTNTWNGELIRSLVDEDTATKILSIPISGSRSDDTLVWKFEGSGVYSVKSEYRALATSLVWAYFQIQIQTIDDSAPEDGVVKINFDVSFQSKDRLATTSVIARDSTGIILGAETYLFENVADSFVAEARACERALFFAKSMGFRRLAVEGDALSVIKSIKKI